MRLLLLAMLGGALGSGLRHLFNVAAQSMGPKAPYVATVVINVVGSFAMGLLIAWLFLPRSGAAQEIRTFFATGVLGGFTTFSAFSLDAVSLAETSLPAAAAYVLASVALSILGVMAGFAVIAGTRP